MIIRKILFFVLMLLFTNDINGQVASGSFGSTYVPSNGFISIFGNHTFDFADCGLFPGLILTERSGIPGVVNFTADATWSDASNDSHIDGYARTFSSGPFVFPIGHDGRLRMLGITGSTTATCAYRFEDPALLTGVMTISNPDLEAVSDREYWVLTGEDETNVTLTWDQLSNVEDLVQGDIDKLTIIGWDGTNWEVIPSTLNDFALLNNSGLQLDEDISTSFSIGSLRSTEAFDPNDFVLLTIGSLSTPRAGITARGDLNIFPNPARLGTQKTITYHLLGERGKLEIYDGQNRLVYATNLTQRSGSIILPEFNQSDDRYVVTLIEEDGRKNSKHLIVVR